MRFADDKRPYEKTTMKKVVTFAGRYPRAWSLLKGAIVVIPSGLLAYAAIKWTTSPLLGQDAIRKFLESHIFVTIGFLVSPILLPHLYAIVDTTVARQREKDYFPRVLSASLIHGLNDIVGLKLRRFAGFVRQMNGNETKGEIFDAITQPDKQMTLLLTNLRNLLHEMTRDDTLQVVLTRMENNLPVEFAERVPNNIQLPPTLLTTDASKTMFAHCARKRTPLVIHDIVEHLSKNRKKRLYHPIGDPDSDRGSIMCHPVFCEASGRIEYVLSIKSDTPKAIDDDFRKLYKVPIESFMTRLLLEHNLQAIKRRAK